MEGVKVADLISAVKEELLVAEARAAKERKMFQLEVMELELKFLVGKDKDMNAEVKIPFFGGGGSATYKDEQVQTIRLKFNVLQRTEAPVVDGERDDPSIKPPDGLGPFIIEKEKGIGTLSTPRPDQISRRTRGRAAPDARSPVPVRLDQGLRALSAPPDQPGRGGAGPGRGPAKRRPK